MLNINPIIGTDSYKVTHWPQYPAKTAGLEAYLEARYLSEYAKTWAQEPMTIAYGAHGYLTHSILGTPVTHEHIEEARDFFADHFGNPALFNEAGWKRVVNRYGGWIPIHVRAVPEGMHVPIGNILMGVGSTDPELAWLTNYMETRLSHAWYPYTVATLSWNCKQIILKYLELSGTPAEIGFKLHDFGFRGVLGDEGAAVGGSAHLVNFMGSDTLIACKLLKDYYGHRMAGFSIPAAEHSTITSWGRARERDAYENMLRKYPTGPVAVVSDSYDIYNACEHIWGEQLHDLVMLHEGGPVVIRPDSGDPHVTLPKILDILGTKFGFTTNQKGYKVLDPHVRVIQGDGVNPNSINTILNKITSLGWSADNLAFGMGGALLQNVNRDTFGFAFKASAIEIDGVWADVSKSPVTDAAKKSKGGRLTLYMDERPNSPTRGQLITARRNLPANEQPGTNVMETIYYSGSQQGAGTSVFIGGHPGLKSETFDTIRERANTPSPKLIEPPMRHAQSCVLSYDNEVEDSHCTCGHGWGV